MTKPSQAYGPVFVAVDFSPQSEQAFLFAAAYARNFHAPLLVLHVLHDPEGTPGVYRMEDGCGGLLPLKDAAQILLERFREQLSTEYPNACDDLEIDFQLSSGLPSNRILEIAERVHARLIVLGNTGQGSFSRLLMGSTATSVMKGTLIPVTLVRALADRDE
jgi:nucleotide-binding universal stress UspA family protein